VTNGNKSVFKKLQQIKKQDFYLSPCLQSPVDTQKKYVFSKQNKSANIKYMISITTTYVMGLADKCDSSHSLTAIKSHLFVQRMVRNKF
jgi:hypothetical protein